MRVHGCINSGGALGSDGFRHEAFFYAGEDDFLDGTISFLEAGVEAGETVLAVLPEPRLELLRGALGPLAPEVELHPMEEMGRNPARLISAWQEILRAAEPGRGVRGLGEPIWAGRSAAELEECERHERLLNVAFAQEQALTALCPYDTRALDDEVLVAAECSHPLCSDARGEVPSAWFDPSAPLEGSLPEPTSPTLCLCFGRSDLRTMRRGVADLAHSAGLGLRRNEDLVLAVCEVATNSIQHGGGRGCLTIWRENDELVCEVRDDGRIEDPLVGRERPAIEQASCPGLWIANQLCDLVQIRSGEQGTQVRLRMSIHP